MPSTRGEDGVSRNRGKYALCISLTAHEALAIVEEQIANVLLHCPNSVVVLHLNRGFRERIAASPKEQNRLDVLLQRERLILNPESLETRWAHMFHAHLSNLRHVRDIGLDHQAVLLMASADLVFRPGLEQHVLSYDAGVGQSAMASHWSWSPYVARDELAGEVLRRSGEDQFRISTHEGSFYKASIAHRMAAVLDEVVQDWEYGEVYPREEVFFPTLAQSAGADAISLPAAYVLGFGLKDKQALAQIFLEAGLAEGADATLLGAWARENAPTDDLLAGRFIISRLPRLMDNPARMIIAALAPGEDSPRSRWLASRMDIFDLAELDAAARTSIDPTQITGVVHRGLLAREHGAVFSFQLWPKHDVVSVDLPACPDQFAVAIVLPNPSGVEASSVSAFGAATPVTVRFSSLEAATLIDVSPGEAEPVAEQAFIFVVQELSRPRRFDRMMLAEYDVAASGDYPVEFWFEVHETTAEETRKEYFNQPTVTTVVGESALQLWTIPDRVRQALSSVGELKAFVYFKAPVRRASIILKRLRFLG
jgi:hypothetical protein